jgi:hypothetical protein
VTAEPEYESGYGTRNKRRKLNEMNAHSPISPQPSPLEPAKPAGPIRHMYDDRVTSPPRAGVSDRNIQRALRKILTTNPTAAKESIPTMHDVIEVSTSADEGGSSVAVASRDEVGRISGSSTSIASRDTTPSSNTMSQIEVPEIIISFERERTKGIVTGPFKEEALKALQRWRAEWKVEHKKVRKLMREIKMNHITQLETPREEIVRLNAAPPRSSERTRRMSNIVVQRERSRSTSNTSKTVETQEVSKSPESGSGFGRRRDSVTGTGPNGLTGHYWDIHIEEMGRGARRRTKDGTEVAALASMRD